MTKEEQIKSLREDIKDKKIAADQAYDEMLKASEWFRECSATLEELQMDLEILLEEQK